MVKYFSPTVADGQTFVLVFCVLQIEKLKIKIGKKIGIYKPTGKVRKVHMSLAHLVTNTLANQDRPNFALCLGFLKFKT